MEDRTRETLTRAGVNIEEALDRFVNNEELLVMFLKKFAEDPSYEALQKAMADKTYDEAFKAAHSLKGVCGNLSIQGLFDIVSKEVEMLRAGMNQAAEAYHPEVVREYERVSKELALL